jgi:hypothetical protein
MAMLLVHMSFVMAADTSAMPEDTCTAGTVGVGSVPAPQVLGVASVRTEYARAGPGARSGLAMAENSPASVRNLRLPSHALP